MLEKAAIALLLLAIMIAALWRLCVDLEVLKKKNMRSSGDLNDRR